MTKQAQCKQEKYAGGGCPSPRECEICGRGPCTKKQSPSKEVDRKPLQKLINQP